MKENDNVNFISDYNIIDINVNNQQNINTDIQYWF